MTIATFFAGWFVLSLLAVGFNYACSKVSNG
jgi:hypothetical protein